MSYAIDQIHLKIIELAVAELNDQPILPIDEVEVPPHTAGIARLFLNGELDSNISNVNLRQALREIDRDFQVQYRCCEHTLATAMKTYLNKHQPGTATGSGANSHQFGCYRQS